MDLFTFIAEIIKSLAWPVTVWIAVYILRKPLAELIPLLNHLKYKDLEVDFSRRLEETESKAAELPQTAPAGVLVSEDQNRLLSEAVLSPRSAILEAWIAVEQAIRGAQSRSKVKLNPNQLHSPLLLVNWLVDNHIIDAGQATILNDLRNLRNSAAHAEHFDPSPLTAERYITLASQIIGAINSSNGPTQ